MAATSSSPHWWKDQFARLLITVVGGVVAALILTMVIPALNDSSEPSGTSDTKTEVPADSGDTPAPETPAPEPAPTDGG